LIKKIVTYGVLFERTLGASSPKNLPHGVNAQAMSGDLLLVQLGE
jgi:hypothetical protein